VDQDARLECPATQRTNETRRLHGRALWEEHAAAEDGRTNALGHLVRVERHRLLDRTERGGSLHGGVDRTVLCRRRRNHQQPALAQPDVVRQRADGGDDPLAGTCERDRSVVAEHGPGVGETRPVAVQETAVSPARTSAAELGFQHDDTRGRFALPHGQGGPEPRVAAADNAHVGAHLALERRRRLVRTGLVPPPRRQARRD
jgi:hypothetical protein